MGYEWDEGKRLENLRKHGVDFAAIERFDWDSAVDVPSPRHGERRWVVYGYIEAHLHTAVCTVRGGAIRIISPRRAKAGSGGIMERPDDIANEISEAEWQEIIAGELSFAQIEVKYGEEVAIYAGIARDPDAEVLTDEDFAQARPFAEAHPQLAERLTRRRGKQKAPLKVRTTIRLDPDIAEYFQSIGPGWQKRLNEVLRRSLFGDATINNVPNVGEEDVIAQRVSPCHFLSLDDLVSPVREERYKVLVQTDERESTIWNQTETPEAPATHEVDVRVPAAA